MSVSVTIVPYDRRWPQRFAREKASLAEALGPRALAIEHIGSTAIPRLCAKPIIDLMVAVRQLDADLAACAPALQRLEFAFEPRPDFLDSRFFEKGPWHGERYHLHVTEYGSAFWEEKLLFRDYLRSHPATAQAYCALKQRLSAQHRHDRFGYTAAKGAFIVEVIALARRTAARQNWHGDYRDEATPHPPTQQERTNV